MKTSQLREKFKEVFGVEAEHTFFSPGRINLIGEHTDYNGGHVFPAAITLGTYGAARKRDDKVLKLVIRLIQVWIFTSMVTFQMDQACHRHHLWNC